MFKRITLALCLGLSAMISPSLAQQTEPQPQPQMMQLPMFLVCSPISPEDTLYRNHGEYGLLEGSAKVFIPSDRQAEGKLKFLMNPDTRSFTVLFVLGQGPNYTYCLMANGKDGEPIVNGAPL